VAGVATGLTGVVHQSDRCSTGCKPCKFLLCVLVCFGSEGCLLVPRSSSTSVAAWAWPTWVVSQRHVLEAVFVLLKSPSPSKRIFISSHSLPPLWFAVSILQAVFGRQKFGRLSAWTSRTVRAAPVACELSVIRRALVEVRLSFSDRPSVTHGPSTCITRTVPPVTMDCPPRVSQSC
jgi:hypothetical protein